MSSALAIASVTAVLRDLLINGLVDQDLTASLGDIAVTALPPDRIDTGEKEKSQLNLFLYQVTPNLGWRNVGLPSRASNGESVAAPPLALDLHYLLSAYGARDFHAEILLGCAMQLLHEKPALGRKDIRTALGSSTVVNGGGGLSATLQALSTSALADQVEQIKICPQFLNTEEASKLWTAVQARLRVSAAYHVSVVLIESRQPVRTPLPVLNRGKEDRGADALAGGNLPFIRELQLPHSQSSALLGDDVILHGENLERFSAVRFTHKRLPGASVTETDNLPANFNPLPDSFEITRLDAQVAAGQITVQLRKEVKVTLPDGDTVPAPWVPGSYTVAVVAVLNGKKCSSIERNFTLAPRIEKIDPPNPLRRDANGNVTLTLTCSPQITLAPVSKDAGGGIVFDQKVELLLGKLRPILPQPPTIRGRLRVLPASTDKLVFVFPVTNDQLGDYVPRLRVDGVEMPRVDFTPPPTELDPTPVPRFDDSHKVSIT